ncbi:MAG: response regulator [Bacteroidales bacterium]|nr:response regulator [Bacteroidales bacterium]
MKILSFIVPILLFGIIALQSGKAEDRTIPSYTQVAVAEDYTVSGNSALPMSEQKTRRLFRSVDSDSGLPDNNVRDMLMLPGGMMCIQTSAMLNLFDGTSSKSFRFDPAKVPYQEYAGLSYLFYHDHSLWFSHQDLTWKFDLATRRFEYDTDKILEPYYINGEQPEYFTIAPDGSYWIVSTEGNLWYCCSSTGMAQQIDLPQGFHAPLTMDISGTEVRMLSLDGAFAVYDTRLHTFTKYISDLTTSGSSSSRMDMAAGSDGDLWIMFDTELIRFCADGPINKIRNVPLGQNDVYTTIAYDGAGRLWVGSAKSGVSILDTRTLSVENLECIETTDGRRIGHNTDISKIYIDPQEGVWIATLTEGVFYWHKNIFRLQTVSNETLDAEVMPDENIKCIVEDADGTILLGTIRGLLRYEPLTGRISVAYPELAGELCTGLYRDSRDRIWLGTFHNGAFCIDRGRIRHYFYEGMPSVEVSYHDATPNFNSVRSFYEDASGNLWICVYGGLGRFDASTGTISLLRDSHPQLDIFMLSRGVSEVEGKLLATSDNGWYLYDPSTDTVTLGSAEALSSASYTDSAALATGTPYADPDALDSSGTLSQGMTTYSPTYIDYRIPCNQAVTDSRGLVWLASSEGLYVMTGDGKNYRLSLRDGLPNDNIVGLAADNIGNIWAATFRAVSRIRPVKEEEGYSFAVTTFGAEEGMNVGTMFQNAMFTARDGRIYLGGSLGFSIADPATLYQPKRDSTPIITGLRVFNHPVEVGEEYNGRCILPQDLSQTRHIRLRHTETFLTFEFSNLNYINPGHTSYRYRLKNFDREWTELHAAGAGSATYTLLKHGDYVFQVMAADNDTDWSEACAEIAVTIAPSFWQSAWAKALYILIGLLIAASVIYAVLRRARRREEARQEAESQRQKDEMDAMKFRFFTNVSHELRTPLSLIILPLENIIRHTSADSPMLPQLQTMHRHVSSLLTMVNQLLDFRKVEMHGETLNYTHGDIAEFIRSHVESFRDTAREKELDLVFDDDMANSMMDFDSEKVFKIVNNLLSNAMKFTPKGGEVAVRLTQKGSDLMVIEVTDTGVGIVAEDLPHIFDRFYQPARNENFSGTGIGLNLVKQFAEMLGGNASVESEVGVGSIFRVELPIRSESSAQSDVKEDAEDEDVEEKAVSESAQDSGIEDKETGKERTRLLVIEDNADFRNYIASELSEEFDVIKAVDGEDGLRKVSKHIIDIIICDVMMPRMDGFELCRRIKNDINTSHIPIILLTAHSNNDVRREGYKAGADAYISKPFSMDVLLARIHNLVEERRRRIRAFATGSEDVSSEKMTATPLDRRLMDKVVECVRKNMGNADYSIEDLADDVAMHRMNLYRKLRTITGMTPSEFMRTVRLREAARLLVSEPDLSVTEISERVGFNTPKYFSRHFFEMFSCTPSAYRSTRHPDTK